MLYVTTRNKEETYPAARAVSQMRGPDGGLYIPMRILPLDDQILSEFAHKPSNEVIAGVLNHLFQTRITPSDLDLCIGRKTVRIACMSHRIAVAELWHNPQCDFLSLIEGISRLVCPEMTKATPWMEIGIRTAVLAAVLCKMSGTGLLPYNALADISVVSGDFYGPMGAWYARAMGFPVGNIVCCCNENASVWELLHNGQLRTDAVSVPTETPGGDTVVPSGLECLIAQCCSGEEVTKYVRSCSLGKIYFPNDDQLDALRQGLQVSVISKRRMYNTIPNVYATSDYVLSSYAALCYAGLLDYRARTGESRCGIILSEQSPSRDLRTVASALDLSEEEVYRILKNM